MMIWADLGTTLTDPSFWFSIRGGLATAGGVFAGLATYHSIELAAGRIIDKLIRAGALRMGFRFCPALTVAVFVFLMLIGGGGGRGFGSGGGEGQGMAPTLKNPNEQTRWIIRVLGDAPLKERMGSDADPLSRYYPLQVSGVSKKDPVNLEQVKDWLTQSKISTGEMTIELHPEDPDEATNPVRLLRQAASDAGWKISIRKVDPSNPASGSAEGAGSSTKS